MRVRPLGAVGVLVILLLSGLPGLGAGTDQPPRVGEIKSELKPPVNIFSVRAVDPEGKPLTYRWSISGSGECVSFTQQGNTSTWTHNDPETCPHDAPDHPATITVVVSDGTNEVTKSYSGGSAPHDPGAEGDPRDEPPPVIFGEEVCAASGVYAPFQPVQSVYADDELFPPSELIAEVPGTRYRTDLGMVMDKPTLLFGVYDGDSSDRRTIHFKAHLTGTKPVPAKVVFRTIAGGSPQVIHEHDAGTLPLAGDCGAPQPVDISIPAPIPGDKAFRFTEGRYAILAELQTQDGRPVPGAQSVVSGAVKDVQSVSVTFIPGRIVPFTGSAEAARADVTHTASYSAAMAVSAEKNIPDYFPLRPGGMPVHRAAYRDLEFLWEFAKQDCAKRNQPGNQACLAGQLLTHLFSRLSRESWEGPHGRPVLVIDEGDYAFLRPGSGGLAMAAKVIVMPRDAFLHWPVAHEIAHTIPDAARETTAECGFSYHWEELAAAGNTQVYGQGYRITNRGVEMREDKPIRTGLMGGAGSDVWIEQCKYKFILDTMEESADPPLFGLTGEVAADGRSGRILDGVTFDGAFDPDRPDGTHALVLRDAGGLEVVRHRFTPGPPEGPGEPRYFARRILQHDDAAQVELVGPDGAVLDRRNVSATPPRPRILEPAEGAAVALVDGAVVVRWAADPAPGGEPLEHALYYSADGGRTWDAVGGTPNATEARVPPTALATVSPDGTAQHKFRVVTSAGMRSGRAEVGFTLGSDAAAAVQQQRQQIAAEVARLAPEDAGTAPPPSAPAPGPTPLPPDPPMQRTPGPALPLVALAVATLAALAPRRRGPS